MHFLHTLCEQAAQYIDDDFVGLVRYANISTHGFADATPQTKQHKHRYTKGCIQTRNDDLFGNVGQ